MPKISQYPSGVAPTASDLLVIARSGANYNLPVSSLGIDGWIPINETWTYASASSITIPTDGTTRYQKGDYLRFKQGGNYKYFVINTVAATSLTVLVNTNHTVANSAITDIYFSRALKPFGFPKYFNYTPTWTSDGVQPAIGNGKLTGIYQARDGLIKFTALLNMGNTTTFGTSTYRLGLPVTSDSSVDPVLYETGGCTLLDLDLVTYYEGICQITPGTSSANFIVGSTIVTSTGPFTFASGDFIWISGEYFY